jgi:transcriptional regulator with XRE-family HTH domain
MKHQPKQVFGPPVNRIADLMAHTTRYAFFGGAKLARDVGVHPATISRIISGKVRPPYVVMARIACAIERDLSVRIDPRDLMAENGEFLTRYACDLAACRGCLPENAHDEFGDLKPAFAEIKPGNWVSSRYPNGYGARKGGK